MRAQRAQSHPLRQIRSVGVVAGSRLPPGRDDLVRAHTNTTRNTAGRPASPDCTVARKAMITIPGARLQIRADHALGAPAELLLETCGFSFWEASLERFAQRTPPSQFRDFGRAGTGRGSKVDSRKSPGPRPASTISNSFDRRDLPVRSGGVPPARPRRRCHSLAKSARVRADSEKHDERLAQDCPASYRRSQRSNKFSKWCAQSRSNCARSTRSSQQLLRVRISRNCDGGARPAGAPLEPLPGAFAHVQ